MSNASLFNYYLIIEEPQHLTPISTWKAIMDKKWR